MKKIRHAKIIEMIQKHDVETQEELAKYLREAGLAVTQATVSRDIRELRLVKAATGDGGYRYVSQASGSLRTPYSSARFETIFRESVLHVDSAGHIVLVKCFSGMANAACEVFDGMHWKEVVGSLSGDDTFFVLMRSEEAAKQIAAELAKYVHG